MGGGDTPPPDARRGGGSWRGHALERHVRDGAGWGRGQAVGCVEAGGGGAGGAEARIGVHSLLLLSAVAEPDSDDLLLHAEAVGDVGDLFGGGLGVRVEGALQGDADGSVNGGPLLSAAADGVTEAQVGGEAVGARTAQAGGREAERAGGSCTVVVLCISIFKPLLKKRLQLAHVLEGEIEGLEPGDGRLGEVVSVHLAHSQTDIALGVAQLDSLLLE